MKTALITGITGQVDGSCHEMRPLGPTPPYGISKMAAHRLCDAYRRRGIYAARRDFGWTPNVGFPALVRMMLEAELKALAS